MNEPRPDEARRRIAADEIRKEPCRRVAVVSASIIGREAGMEFVFLAGAVLGGIGLMASFILTMLSDRR